MITPLFTATDLKNLNKNKSNSRLSSKYKVAKCLGDLTCSEFFEIAGNTRKFSCYITSNNEWAVLHEDQCIAYAYNTREGKVRFAFSKYGITWEQSIGYKLIKCYGDKKPNER